MSVIASASSVIASVSEAIQWPYEMVKKVAGLLRRYAPRNDGELRSSQATFLAMTPSPSVRKDAMEQALKVPS